MTLTHDELEFLSAWRARNGSPRVTGCRPIACNWLTVSRAPS